MNNKKYEAIPTKQNIDYMFQRLITSIVISMNFEPYKDYWQDYNKLFEIVSKWVKRYYDTDKLFATEEELKLFDNLITDLKLYCLSIDTRYVEEVDIWHMEYLNLYEKSKEERN